MPRSPRLSAAPSPAVQDSLKEVSLLENVAKLPRRVKRRKACVAEASTAEVAKPPTMDAPRKKKKRVKSAAVTDTSSALVSQIASSMDAPLAAKSTEKRLKKKKLRKVLTPDAPATAAEVQTKPDDFLSLSKKDWVASVKQAQSSRVAPVRRHSKSVSNSTSLACAAEATAPSAESAKQVQAHVVPASSAASVKQVQVSQAAPIEAKVEPFRDCFLQAAAGPSKTASDQRVAKHGVKRKSAAQLAQTADAPKVAKIEDVVATKVEVLGVVAFRKAHDIVVTGTCPAPIETFEACESQFGKELVAGMRAQGYAAPTPIQAQCWPIAARGQDMVAVAKTGSGKTCGFMMPALARLRECEPVKAPQRGEPTHPKVLVIAPTRELAQQIAGEAEKFAVIAGARVVALYGGVPKNDQVRDLQQGADIVIATPGRLMDFTTAKPDKCQNALVALNDVSFLVLDEADRMLDMGFEQDIRKIVAQCPKGGRPEDAVKMASSDPVRQTMFFTATWPKSVQRTASSLIVPGAVQIRVGQGAGGDKLTANKDVTQVVSVIDEKQKLTKLLEILEKELGPGESAFVFAKTKKTCDYLEQKLWDEKEDLSIGTWCRAMHSHKEQWERDASLATFRNITTGKDNGRRGILVATDVAARGLDVPGVAMVVVYDFGGGNLGEDSGVESYVHRIGRTGRAGKGGKAYTFFTEDDQGAYKFVKLLDDAKQRVPVELRALADKRGGGGGGKGGKGGKGSWGGKGGGGKGSGKGKSKGGKGKSKGGKGGKGGGKAKSW